MIDFSIVHLKVIDYNIIKLKVINLKYRSFVF